jgi:hypothetical protein
MYIFPFYNSELNAMPVDELSVAGLPEVNPEKFGKDNQVPSVSAAILLTLPDDCVELLEIISLICTAALTDSVGAVLILA